MNSSNTTSAVVAHYLREASYTDLRNEAWELCEPVRIEHYWSGEIAPATRHAEARICWNEAAVNVRFVCEQHEPLVIEQTPQTNVKTIGLWDRDVCEVFLAPSRHQSDRYYEFEAAPTGEWLDVAIQWQREGRTADWNFDSRMTTAARVANDRVTLAMRIPWSASIPQPQQGDRWRVNLFRCVGKDPDRGYLAWQPTKMPKPGFHLPEVFGWLIFA